MVKVFFSSEIHLYDYAGIEWATGLISNQDGSIYYAGFSRSPDDFGGENFQADLALISANGAIEWSETIADGNTFAYGIAAAPDGGVYVFGHQNKGGFDCYARRYDRLGQLQWSRLIGTSQVDQGMASASDATGRLYTVGYTQGDYAGINAGSNDIILTSINSDGTIAWRTQAGSNGSDIAMAIAAGPNGLIYVAGFTDGSFGSQQNAGLDDGFLACFNSAGELLWNRLIGGSGTDHAYGLRVFTDGSIYVTGRQQRNQNTTASTDEGDVFISRFNTLGDLLWTRYLGSSGYEYGRSIAESADSLALITGRTNGALEGRLSHGGFDAFVAAFDSSGTRVHLDTIGTPYDDAGNIIIAGQDGSLYLSGMAGGHLNGKNHSQAGTYDAFVAKIRLAEADITIDLIASNIDESPRSVAPGESTSDNTPVLYGRLSAPLTTGDRLVLYNGTHALFEASVDNTSLTWSATPSLGSDGTYAITARVVDAAGNQGPASTQRTFILDTLAPLQAATITAISDNTGTIQGPIAQGGISNDNTPTLSGTLAAPLAAAEVLTIYRNGIATGNAAVNTTSLTWSFTPTPSTGGSHSFTAAVVDGAGNQGPLSSPYTIQLDTLAPTQTAAITSIQDNVGATQGNIPPGGITNDTTPTLSGTFSAPLTGGETLKLYKGNTFLIDVVVDNNALTWSATPTIATLSTNTTYAITARVVDAVGNQGPASSSRSFILDTLAPLQAATITAISDNTGTIQGVVADGAFTNDNTPTVSGTLSAPLSTGEVLTIFRNGIAAGNATINNSTRSWIYTTAALNSNGTHSFTAAVVDAAGNRGPLSNSRSIVLDITPPTQSAVISAVLDNTDPQQGLVANGGRTNDTTPTITGTVSAAMGEGENLKLYNGSSFLVDAIVDPISLTWSATPTLTADGTYTINARVVDAAGNQGPASSSRSFILDTLAPTQTVAITSITDNLGTIQGVVADGAFTNDNTPTVSGTLSAPLSTGEVLTIFRNGIAAGNATINNSTRSWIYTTAALNSNGTHSFTAAVVDAAGNRGPLSSPYQIKLDAGSFETNRWSFDWSTASILAGTPGLLMAKAQVDSPRNGEPPLSVTALRVDLQTPGISLSSTAPIANWQANVRETFTQTARDFITGSRLQGSPVVAAINTAFFDLIDPIQFLPTNLEGLAVSNHVLVSPTDPLYPYFMLDSITGARIERDATITPDLNTTKLAFSGMSNGIVLWDDMVTIRNNVQNARTGLGLSSDNRYMVLMTVDRSLRSPDPTYWGATFDDVGSLLYGFGASRGLNLDGGGSTQMAWWEPTSASAQLLNAPLLGIERNVGSLLGIVYQPPG